MSLSRMGILPRNSGLTRLLSVAIVRNTVRPCKCDCPEHGPALQMRLPGIQFGPAYARNVHDIMDHKKNAARAERRNAGLAGGKGIEMNERMEALRKEMRQEGLDAWLVPSGDPHLSEYVADHWKTRAWLSGFTGSAGTLLVTMDKALLWTDGRYFVQAEGELAGSGIELMKMATPGFPTVLEWLEKNLSDGARLGLDATLYAAATLKEYEKKLNVKQGVIVGDFDLPGRIWTDRPAVPATPVFVHDAEYAGFTPSEKITRIRERMVR